MISPSRRHLFLLIVLGALAVTALALLLAPRAAPVLITATALRGEFVIDIGTTGQIEAVNSRSVSRKRTGWSWGPVQIVQLAPEGSIVKEGDFLVQLDQADAQRQLDEARNMLQNAQAELARQQATSASRLAELESALLIQQYSYEQARLRTEAMEFEAEARRREQELELRKAELSLRDARDRLDAQQVIAQADLNKAEFEVRKAEMQVAQAQEGLDALTLTAPEPGLVVYRTTRTGKVKVGDQTWPGWDIIELPDLSLMQVRTRVNEIDVHQVREGQEVVIRVDALADQVFRGQVSRIATLARTEGEAKIKVFDVDVLIEGEGGDLRPGMTAQCRIVTGRIPDAVYVPLEAVVTREGQSLVHVIDGGVRPRPVVLGPRNDDFVVVESGLEAGEVVSLRDPERPLPTGPTGGEADDEPVNGEARP